MKILVTGRTGQLAQSLAEQGIGIDWVFAGRQELDLSVPGEFARAIEHICPDFIINAAAYTAVDNAEDEEAIVFRINAEAAREGAEAAAMLAVPFLQVSTDYVFDGSGTRSWRESDPVSPVNAYGRSKAKGEEYVLQSSPLHSVVRTSWLFGPFGRNFVKTMLRLATDRDEIRVVADQRGCPTSTLDLADALIAMAKRVDRQSISGVWHIAGCESASWADFAHEIFRISGLHGGPSAKVIEIRSSEFFSRAVRPMNSVLDYRKAELQLGITLPSWRVSLRQIIPRLLSEPFTSSE